MIKTPVLEPCSCCNADAVVIPHSMHTTIRFSVKCCNDGCGLQTNHFSSEEIALDVWNQRPPTQSDALREALAELLHAVCGEKGFAQAVRRDSGRIYPWPALDIAEAKARKALEQNK